MNIPDEYFADEMPEGGDFCAIKWPSGIVEMCSIHAARVFAREPNAMGARFCRLVPAAEMERLKTENERLRELGAALRDSAANLGYTSSLASTVISRATKNVEAWDAYIARLEGRAE